MSGINCRGTKCHDTLFLSINLKICQETEPKNFQKSLKVITDAILRHDVIIT